MWNVIRQQAGWSVRRARRATPREFLDDGHLAL